ncbi:MAG: hypothetical protein IJF02_03165 [Oscillospiraceae bacterium]|nr:hypothetical protein [Oscillospiraceae bacterium]
MKKPIITITGHTQDMQPWYETKCKRALEEMALLSSTLRRPGTEPAEGWRSRQEEVNYHLSLAIKNLLILTGCTCGKYIKLRVQDIECILYEGFPGYQKVMEKIDPKS